MQGAGLELRADACLRAPVAQPSIILAVDRDRCLIANGSQQIPDSVHAF